MSLARYQPHNMHCRKKGKAITCVFMDFKPIFSNYLNINAHPFCKTAQNCE